MKEISGWIIVNSRETNLLLCKNNPNVLIWVYVAVLTWLFGIVLCHEKDHMFTVVIGVCTGVNIFRAKGWGRRV